MAELTLEDWIPMSPLKGPPLPNFLNIYWPWYKEELPPEEQPPAGAADIRVEDLAISPAQVNVGDKVTISVTATNYGTASGSKTITLSVNGTTSSQTVTLTPSQSLQVNFEVSPQEGKTYNVSVDGLTGSFIAAVPNIPFSMAITNVETMTDPIATSFWTAQLTVKITNNSNSTITHVLRCGMCRPGKQNENDPAVYTVLRYWDVMPATTQLSVTLGPGESITHVSPYYVPGTNYINQDLSYHSGERIRYAWRILDELNNMSPSAYAGSYP